MYGAEAQQPASPPAGAPAAAQPLPPGSPMIGRPDNEAAQKLAPVAPPPLAAAPDKLPVCMTARKAPSRSQESASEPGIERFIHFV